MTTDTFLKPDEAGMATLAAFRAEINALLEGHRSPTTLDAALLDFTCEVEGSQRTINRSDRLRFRSRMKPKLPIARRSAIACMSEMLEVLDVYMGETGNIDESRVRLHSLRIADTQADGEAIGKANLKKDEVFTFGPKEHLVAGFNCFSAVQSDQHLAMTGKLPTRVIVGGENAISYSSTHVLETRGLAWAAKEMRNAMERTFCTLNGDTYAAAAMQPGRPAAGVIVVPHVVGMVIEQAHADIVAASPPAPGKSNSVH